MPLDPSIFEAIDVDLRILEIDDIKRRLEPLMKGYQIQSPVFDAGQFLYRAREVDATFNKPVGIRYRDLIYPPAHKAQLGRLNRAGTPIFYSSIHKESVFFELPGLDAGSELILTFWKTTERMFVNNVGYTEFAFQQLGAKRAVPTWAPLKAPGSTDATVSLSTLPPDVVRAALSNDESRDLKEAFSKYFMREVTSPAESFRYKLTVAIGEMHLGHIATEGTQFAGVLYPSVRMWANGDNVALLPWFVDKHLAFRKAVYVRIKGRTATSIEIDYQDAAHEFGADGSLKWLGRVRGWSVPPQHAAKFLVVAGQDDDGGLRYDRRWPACALDGNGCGDGQTHRSAVEAAQEGRSRI
jgi:hypothetical protein